MITNFAANSVTMPPRARLRAGTALAGLTLLVLCAGGPARAGEAKAQNAPPSAIDSAAVTQAAHFEEKLVPAGPSTAAENAALLAALTSYAAQPAKDDLTPFEEFLAAHPRSAWAAALRADMGLLHYHYGYFSRAISDWQAAWEAGRDSQDRQVKALVDRVAGELLRMHARLGHADILEKLTADMAGRKLTGAATEDQAGAAQGLWMMRNNPGVAYLCGPMALKNLLLSLGHPAADVQFLDTVRSGPHGVSLAQVADLAHQAKVDFSVIHRDPGQPIPVPAVVHWKVGHFAAIVGLENGLYHVKDPTFGEDLWVARGALETETSGYYLTIGKTAAEPWRKVAESEAATIRGMGYTGSNDPHGHGPHAPKGPCGGRKGSSASGGSGASAESCAGGFSVSGLARYTFDEMQVSLAIQDTPVGYTPPKGPALPITLTYNQRESDQPANFGFYNISPKWSLNWLAYIQDDPNNIGASVERLPGGGGAIVEGGFQGGNFAAEEQTGGVLSLVPGAVPTYRLTFPDGSYDTYSVSNGATTYPRIILISGQTDKFGNSLTFTYDSQLRLTTIRDATGRNTVFSYTNTSFPLQITKIADPFGRAATLTYDTSGRLAKITDVLGLSSSFTYDSNSLVNALTTPYGTTNFAYGAGQADPTSLYLQATDPLGYTERVEFEQNTPGIAFSDPSSTIPVGIVAPFNEYLNSRDTFYWDKHAYALAAGNYTQARNRHWAHLAANTNETSDVIESIRFPLENRVWFNYPGQPNSGLGGGVSGTLDSPTVMGRVLDDGSTQLTQYTYNKFGNVTSETDPVGRVTTYSYAANGVDLLSVAQKTGPGTTATIAQYGSYLNHLPQTYTDAAGQVFKLAYNAGGQVTQTTDPLGHTVKYTYNTSGTLAAVINQNGVTAVSYTYDAFGRVLTQTDSEGLTVTYAYDALDRLTKEAYPDGTARLYTWTNLDLTAVTDRQGRTTKFTYDADRNIASITAPQGDVTHFAYYENGELKSATDANGNITTWSIDIEGRPTGKTFADGTTVTETYQNTISRLAVITDALGQTKQFSYTADDRLAGITYVNAVNPTPPVSYTYDPYFPRVASMTDGTGTTTYSYVAPGARGALSLAQEIGPQRNGRVVYNYDPLGRMVRRMVAGNPETYAYDAIGRVVGHGNDIGEFVLSYLGQTDQVTSQKSAVVGSSFTYDTNTHDRHLLGINNGPVARAFAYVTTPENDITGITESLGAAKQSWTDSYDKDDHLLTAALSTGASYTYGYDSVGNLTGITAAGKKTTIPYNKLNQPTAFNGTTFTRDSDGNLTADDQRAYSWDAEGRLVGLSFPGKPGISESFAYDGNNHLVSATAQNGATSTTTHFFWCGESLCEQRDANDKVIRRFFAEGEEAPAAGTLLYYGLDQKGDVRDILSAQTGALVGSVDYDPYGNVLKTTGQVSAGFGFGQMLGDTSAALMRANFRFYDPRLGTWISRNPSGEAAGPNAYGYAAGNPIGNTDPLGADDATDDEDAADDAVAGVNAGTHTYTSDGSAIDDTDNDANDETPVRHTGKNASEGDPTGAKGTRTGMGKTTGHNPPHPPHQPPHQPPHGPRHSPHKPKPPHPPGHKPIKVPKIRFKNGKCGGPPPPHTFRFTVAGGQDINDQIAEMIDSLDGGDIDLDIAGAE